MLSFCIYARVMQYKGKESELVNKLAVFEKQIMNNETPFYLVLLLMTTKLFFLIFEDDMEKTTTIFNQWKNKLDNFQPVSDAEKSIKAYYYHTCGVYFNHTYEFLESYNCYMKSLNLSDELINRDYDVLWQNLLKNQTLSNLVLTHLLKGEMTKALEIAKKSYEINKQSKSKFRLASASQRYGEILFLIGKTQDAIEKYRESYKLIKEFNQTNFEYIALVALIGIYLKIGDYPKAFEDIKQLELLLKDSNKMKKVTVVISSKIQYYMAIGEPQKALDLELEYLNIMSKNITKNKKYMIEELIDTVNILIELNKIDLAYNYLDQIFDSLKIKMESPILEFEFNFKLINTLIKLHELKKANDIYNRSSELIKFLEEHGSIYYTNLHKYSHAILIKNESRLKDKLGAINEFEALINLNDPVYYEISVKSIINTIDLLLIEYQSDHNNEIIKEITEYSKKLHLIVTNQQNIAFKIESLILASKISIIEGKIDNSQQLLEEALTLANQNNLNFYSQKIIEEQGRIRNESKEKVFPLNEISQRIKFSDVENYIKDVMQSNLLK